MSDSIYRHEAIRTITSYNGVVDKSVAKRLLLQMPSAQLERAIKDCRNCKHGNYNDHWDTYFCYHSSDCNDWDKWEPSAEPKIIRCKNCKYWRQQTNHIGVPLSFGFCESDNMWRSLHGETCEVSHIDTDDDFYCGYAERRTE